MKSFTVIVVAVVLASVGIALAGGEPQDRRAKDRPAFLQRLVGEWSVVVYAVTDPNVEPYRFEGKEAARMLGTQWLVSEFVAEVEGVSINSIHTIGYDRSIGKFVASYANSNQTMLWTYNGTLDDEGTTLTLATKGPFMGDPNQQADYRVVIVNKEADRWTMGSQILVPDSDEWVEFLRFEYRRKQ